MNKKSYDYECGHADAMEQVTTHIKRVLDHGVDNVRLMQLVNDVITMRHDSMVKLMTHKGSVLQGGN